MKYWDTSAILRAWKEGWPPPTGMTRSHSIAEWISIQTGRGLVYQRPDGTLVKQNLPPGVAALEARRIFQNLIFCDLTGEQILEATDLLGKRTDIAGVAIHDFMHARAAELNSAECIVTINSSDFSRMTQLPLETPTHRT
jgi:hypothetical protein